jgi:hypothetical protein
MLHRAGEHLTPITSRRSHINTIPKNREPVTREISVFGMTMTASQRGLDQMGVADRIGALRLESGRSELELANELGLTVDGYCDLEQQDSELESVLSIAQALKLGPFLEGADGWMSVYTVEFNKKLAIAIEVDGQVVLGG